MPNKIYLVLQNGEVFEGKSFGYTGDTVGELVFTTGMNGFVETITDPCYYGQIVIQTFPEVGSYGVNLDDTLGLEPTLSGYIAREYCEKPSNFRCQKTLDEYLKENKVIGMYGVDTRELTTMIREAGVMNAKITADVSAVSDILREIRRYVPENAVEKFSTREISRCGSGKKVVMMDFGFDCHMASELMARGCEIIEVPAFTSAEEILKLNPDGVVLSEGAGDPQENRQIISEIAILAEKRIPIFGMGLGHQLLALAMGAHTRKAKYGHRGTNQPVRDMKTGRVFVTTQNHGYSVISKSLPKYAAVSHTNVNDGSCEGIEYSGYPCFSVQFRIGKASVAEDTTCFYDKFIKLMEENSYAER